MSGHEDPKLFTSRWGVLAVCRCGWKSKSHPTTRSASLAWAEHVAWATHNDGSRCSPDHPCPERNDRHVLLWGECFYMQLIDGEA